MASKTLINTAVEYSNDILNKTERPTTSMSAIDEIPHEMNLQKNS